MSQFEVNVKKYFSYRKSYGLLHFVRQNEITKISGLSCLPELTECWLQENGISELNGFEFNLSIQDLGELGMKVQSDTVIFMTIIMVN